MVLRGKGRDPVKARLRREKIREAQKRIGDEALPKKGRTGKGTTSQMDHGSSSKAIKKRRDGQRAMETDRPDLNGES